MGSWNGEDKNYDCEAMSFKLQVAHVFQGFQFIAFNKTMRGHVVITVIM